MKIESTAFTQADLQGFLDEMLDRERMLLADRLERASERLARIGALIRAGSGEDQWTDHEVLAHIAVLSKFYGVLVHKITSGQLDEVDLLGNTNLRDAAGEQMAQIEPAELLKMIQADHARTAKLLRTVEVSALRREVKTETGRMVTAEYLARFPLINHLEQHVAQLEKSFS
jgi:Mycothiol maleylpyruvate isomerase N-terminal domain